MSKTPAEWLKQSDFDMKAALAMFEVKNYIYSVFMCHLSVEKALKGLYLNKLGEPVPKTHNLIYLLGKIEIELPENLQAFITSLNDKSVPTRYPEDLQTMLKDYNKKKPMNFSNKAESC